MATFVNQTANLSALSAALESLGSILDVDDDNRTRSPEARQEQADMFLRSQRNRVAAIDENLHSAMVGILPPHPEMKTVTELAELCRYMQEGTRRKLKLLKRVLESRGVDTERISWSEEEQVETKCTAPSTPLQQPLFRFSFGGPLESVIEGDVETEGATTPGSLIQPSPFYSESKRKTSLTPTTPTMDRFSFSAGTNSLIHNMAAANDSEYESKADKLAPLGRKKSMTPDSKTKLSGSFDSRLRFDEFQEEDDMITLESRSTVAPKSPASRVARSPAQEDKSQFLSRMESLLERVEESVLESRPSDETDRLSKLNASSSFSQSMRDDYDEETEADDDSTNVVATQVASVVENYGSKRTRLLSPGRVRESYADKPKVQRPAQIFFDTAASSPAHTNITMDLTMANETFAGMSILDEDDNISTVTPVLDRYRLDPDDNSVGIKVVPNQRGSHKKSRKSIAAPPSVRTFTAESKQEFVTSPDGLRSPVGLPGSVSARKKQYRKTPYRTQQYNNESFETNDENVDPNVHIGGKQYRKTPFPKKELRALDESSYSYNNKSDSSDRNSVTSNDFAISIPPLRPRSFETTRSAPLRDSSTRAASLPARRSSRSPLSDAFAAKHLSSDRERETNNNVSIESNSVNERVERMVKWMERITMAEYERAPNIVKGQVKRDEANESLDALEDFLTEQVAKNPEALEFTETQGYQVLRKNLGSDQKSKSVLMSLCHWRRLLMFRDETHGMVFRVNQFEQ